MKLNIVYNSIIPFKGFLAITFIPWVFVRKEYSHAFTERVLNHECIHACQQAETLFVSVPLAVILAVAGCGWWSLLAIPLYYWIYFIEWIVRSVACGSTHEAYRAISAEQEAYANESDPDYLTVRRYFAWIKLFNKK